MADKPVEWSNFKEKKQKATQQASETTPVAQWWTAEEKDLPGAVMQQVQAIIRNDRARLQDYNVYSRLYGHLPPSTQWLGTTAGKAQAQQSQSLQANRVAFNLVQVCTDTLTSKMCKNKPAPFFLTSKGDYKIQRKAQKLTDFAKGLFYANKAYLMGRRAFRDACVWGEGIIHVFTSHGRVCWERVMPYEIFVDFLEAHYGPESTKTMHRVKQIDRTTLLSMFPEKEKEIAGLGLTAEIFASANKSVSDVVSVIESWRLPSGPDSDDGVHCITSQGVTLFVERYSRSAFPFAVLRYSDALHGFWGQSLTAQLMPIQVELNRCLLSIQRSLYMMGTYKILVHAGSKVVDTHFDNRVGTIIKWAGEVQPQYVTPPAVQPEIYQQVVSLKEMGYEQSGVSQLSAASIKPVGLDSGRALRENVDIETDRFMTVGQQYEEFYLQLTTLSIEEARDIYKNTGKISVTVPGKRFIQTIDWKDVDLEDDQYVLQCFPISKLPSDPEGRLQTIQELMQAGIVSPDVGRRLLDFPDLDAEENLANAQLDYIHQILEQIIEGGEYTAPEPEDNLQVTLKTAIEYLSVGKRDALENDRLDLLRTFIKQTNDLITAATLPPMAPPPGAPGAAPSGQAPANPMPPPVSGMIPNGNVPG